MKTILSISVTAVVAFFTAWFLSEDKVQPEPPFNPASAKYVLAQGKMQVICDGVKTYNFDGAKTITVTSLEESGQTLSPQKILSGDYAKDFVCKLIGNKAGQSEIEMKPIDPRKNFSKVSVFVDNAKSMITKAVILDKSNNTLQVSFSNLVSNKALDNALFVFNKAKYPKDVEILD